MDALCERLISQTIALGGSNEANRDFSTKEIAKKTGVSEPTLFSRFPNKSSLIEASIARCANHFTAFGSDLIERGIYGREWLGKMIDHQIEKKEESIFLLNYAHSFDNGADPDHEGVSFRGVVTAAGKKLLRRYEFKNDEEIFVCFSGISRMILYTVAYIVNGVWPDTEDVRDAVYTLSMGGLNSFLEKKVVS
jgi:Bacterial regulatory proteins, tetR family.